VPERLQEKNSATKSSDFTDKQRLIFASDGTSGWFIHHRVAGADPVEYS
jgi:hypothetical protein